MTAEQAVQAAKSTSNRAGKYLTFVLAEENCGFEILKVHEIIGMTDITTVPRTPDYVQGIINLRGRVIPVIDLRLRFGMPSADPTEETCIIVVCIGGVEIGAIVDQVSEVIEVAGVDIEDLPSFRTSVDTDFILGRSKAEDKVTILLNADKIFGDGDVGALTSLASESEAQDA